MTRSVLSLGLLGAALLAGYIGGGDVLSAITGNGQDSPDLVLIAFGAAFLLTGGVLATLALISTNTPTRAPLATLAPLVGVPWWDALGPAGAIVNLALLLTVIALARHAHACRRKL